MFIKKYGDLIVAVFFMALSAFMMIMAKALPKSAVMEIGPDFMPMCVGILTFILAAALLILSVRRLKGHVAEVEKEGPDNVDYKSVLLSFAVILVYVFVLQPIGFIVSTIVYLPVQMFILSPAEKKNTKGIIQLLVIGVVFTFVVFFLFRYGFKIVLPAGIFTINL